MKYQDRDFEARSGTWLLSFILGGLAGAAVALLFAPKSGRQTREQIREMAHEARDRADEYYDQARTAASDYYDKAKTTASTVAQKGAEILREIRPEKEAPPESTKAE